MSWAKACLSSSSTMALPPYLTTTSLSWNRCSQGRASARTPAFSPARLSRRSRGVRTVLLHVAVRQVGGEDLRGAVAEAERDLDEDVRALEVGGGPVAGGHAALAEQHAVDRDVDPVGVDGGVGVPDGGGDAAPVRVRAEEGRLDEAVAGHGPGDRDGVVLGG